MNIFKTKWFNALLVLFMLLGTLGVKSAAAKCDPAKSDNCPTEAPGQQVNTDTDTDAVVNNGGQTLPDNAVANGVVKKEDDTVTLVNNGGQTLPDNAVANGVVSLTNTASDSNTSGGNPHLVDTALLEAFEATLSFGCGTGASHSNVSCWNHFTMTNLYSVQNNGTLKPVCRDTSNANNELVHDNGGWAVILSKFYTGMQNGGYELGPTYQCGGNPHGGIVQ